MYGMREERGKKENHHSFAFIPRIKNFWNSCEILKIIT